MSGPSYVMSQSGQSLLLTGSGRGQIRSHTPEEEGDGCSLAFDTGRGRTQRRLDMHSAVYIRTAISDLRN